MVVMIILLIYSEKFYYNLIDKRCLFFKGVISCQLLQVQVVGIEKFEIVVCRRYIFLFFKKFVNDKFEDMRLL